MIAIASKAFRDVRTVALSMAVTALLCGILFPPLYNSYSDFVVELKDLPMYRAFTGTDINISEPGGYLAAAYFSWIPPLLAVIAIITATGALAGQEANGSLDLVLAQPLRRWRLVTGIAVGIGAALVAASLMAIPGIILGVHLANVDLGAGRVTLVVLANTTIVLFHLALALWLAALLPSRSHAIAGAIGVLTLGYFLESFGAAVDALHAFQLVSPFYWAEPGAVFANGIQWARLALILGATAVFFGLAIVSFERRDIAAARPLFAFRLPSLGLAGRPLRRRVVPLPPQVFALRRRRFPLAILTAKNMRGSVLGVGLTAAVMALWLGIYYPVIQDELESMDVSWIEDLTGGLGYTTAAGFFSVEYFIWIPLLFVAVVVAAATGAVAGEERDGTIDAVLSSPISRRRYLLERAAGIALATLAGVLISLPGFFIGYLFGDVGLSVAHTLLANMVMAALIFAFGAVALAFAALLPSRLAAVLGVSAIATVTYIMNLLASLVPRLQDLRNLSPFYWADAGPILAGHFDWPRFAALLATIAIAMVIAVAAFERREIGSASWPALPWRRGESAPRAGSGTVQAAPGSGAR